MDTIKIKKSHIKHKKNLMYRTEYKNCFIVIYLHYRYLKKKLFQGFIYSKHLQSNLSIGFKFKCGTFYVNLSDSEWLTLSSSVVKY